MNDSPDAPIVENSTVDLVLGGDSPVQDGSAEADTPVLPPVPVLPSESVSSSADSETMEVTSESMESTSETVETSIENITDAVEIPIPSISSNEIGGGGFGNLSPSLSGNSVITISGNDIADLITSTISGNELKNGTLAEEQNLQYISLLETQNGYLSSINSTMSCLLFFTLLTWAVGIIKRITGGFAGYGHE